MKNIAFIALVLAGLLSQAAAQTPSDYKEALGFSRAEKTGTLATLSDKDAAQPNASFATFFLDVKEKAVVFYLNRNARHSHDMAKNPQISFMISSRPADISDPNNWPRLTFSGKVTPLATTDPQYEATKKAYFERFPDAKGYENAAAFHEFVFYVLKPSQMRYIAGFGRVYDLDSDNFWNAGT